MFFAAGYLHLRGVILLTHMSDSCPKIGSKIIVSFSHADKIAVMVDLSIIIVSWNVQRYQAGANNQINQNLSSPELFDMSVDMGESYNQAARYPEVVQDLKRRIAEALRTFPDEIQQANAELMK